MCNELKKRQRDLSSTIELGSQVLANLCLIRGELFLKEYEVGVLNDTIHSYYSKLLPIMEEFNLVCAKLDNDLPTLKELEEYYDKKLSYKGEQKNG